MEIEPAAGIQIIPLPDGNVAIVLVELASPSVAKRIARALTAFAKTSRGGA